MTAQLRKLDCRIDRVDAAFACELGTRAAGMVTLAQVTRLEARIAALADKMNPTSGICYEVELLWIQPDGSALDGEGNPVVHRPGVIALNFGERG